MASFYTLSKDGMHVHMLAGENTCKFLCKSDYFYEAFSDLAQNGGDLELSVLDGDGFRDHFLNETLRQHPVDFSGTDSGETSPPTARDQDQEEQQFELYVSACVPLYFITRLPECYRLLKGQPNEELPTAYATKSVTVINTLPQAGQPGEVVYRHVIGVLEVIKRVGQENEDDDDNGGNNNQLDLFTELDVLKLSRFASTTAAIVGNANLLGNLAKKVMQMEVVSLNLEPFVKALPEEVEKLRQYAARSPASVAKLMPQLKSLSYTDGSLLPKNLRSLLIVNMFEVLFTRGENAFRISRESLLHFIIGVSKNMRRKNPYHNYANLFDSVQAAYVILLQHLDKHTPLERLGFFIATICRDCGHYGVTNEGFERPVSTVCSIFPKPYMQNIAFKITLNILAGSHSILAGFGQVTSKRLLQLVKKLILISDQETFKRAFPRFDADKGMGWEDEGHRLQVLKALSAFLPNIYAYRPCPYKYGVDILLRHLMVEFCEQGFKEQENGFSVPPLFDAKKFKQWPKAWLEKGRKHHLPITEFLVNVDSSFSILETPLKALLKYIEDKEANIVAQLEANYRKNMYPCFTKTGKEGKGNEVD